MVDLLKIKSLTSSLPLDSDLGNEKKKKDATKWTCVVFPIHGKHTQGQSAPQQS